MAIKTKDVHEGGYYQLDSKTKQLLYAVNVTTFGSCVKIQWSVWDDIDKKWNDSSSIEPGETPFYDKCCELTLDNKAVGIVDGFGLVSSSGYGDGGYPLYVREKDGKVVGAKIVFIGGKRKK